MPVGTTDVVKATAILKGSDGVTIENVYQLQLLGAGSLSDSDAMADIAAWMDDLYAMINPYLSSLVTYVQIDFYNKTDGYPMGTLPWPTMTAGGDTGDPLPPGVAPLVVLHTGIPHTLGRKFLPQVGLGETADGDFTAPFVSVLAGYAAELLIEFLGDVSGLDWVPGIVTKSGVFHNFVSSLISAIPAYQRRRRPGTGI